MTDETDRTFRLGDRVVYRVIRGRRQPDAGHAFYGDIIGIALVVNGIPLINRAGTSQVATDYPSKIALVGWKDGKKTWEKPIELRLASDC